MQLQVMTLKYDAARGQFDTAALNEFTRDKVVLRVREHLHHRPTHMRPVFDSHQGQLPGGLSADNGRGTTCP